MNNKKIWILRTGEPIFSDGIDIRPQRAINLARKMSSLGFDVKLISPIFYHQKKFIGILLNLVRVITLKALRRFYYGHQDIKIILA